MRLLQCASAALALASANVLCDASPITIPGLFNTGVDQQGVALPPASFDPHYSVWPVFTMGMVVSEPAPQWVPNSPNSQWIWQTQHATPSEVLRHFRITFDLSGFDHHAVSITGFWGTANIGHDIRINGVSTGQTSGSASVLTPFIIDAGFLPGDNLLEFVVESVAGKAGFRVDGIAGSLNIPAPGFLAVTIGTLLLTVRRPRAGR